MYRKHHTHIEWELYGRDDHHHYKVLEKIAKAAEVEYVP